MITGKMIIQNAEVKKGKEGKSNYGMITLIAMGVSPLDMFCSQDMANETIIGAEYLVEFKLKGKELNGIASMKLVK